MDHPVREFRTMATEKANRTQWPSDMDPTCQTQNRTSEQAERELKLLSFVGFPATEAGNGSTEFSDTPLISS